mmetsp:Transcript_14240/g.53517  ORF Transcript_14240/g.53517 Transcript_14240/m.53517 type:complete len:242 (+) Transcript_14240:235-960(+)
MQHGHGKPAEPVGGGNPVASPRARGAVFGEPRVPGVGRPQVVWRAPPVGGTAPARRFRQRQQLGHKAEEEKEEGDEGEGRVTLCSSYGEDGLQEAAAGDEIVHHRSTSAHPTSDVWHREPEHACPGPHGRPARVAVLATPHVRAFPGRPEHADGHEPVLSGHVRPGAREGSWDCRLCRVPADPGHSAVGAGPAPGDAVHELLRGQRSALGVMPAASHAEALPWGDGDFHGGVVGSVWAHAD